MAGFAVILLIVVLIFVFRMMSRVVDIDKKMDNLIQRTKIEAKKREEILQRESSTVVIPVVPEPTIPQPIVRPPEQKAPETLEPKRPVFEEAKPVEQIREPSVEQVFYTDAPQRAKPKPTKPPKPSKPSFMERNPDLEKFIGENLLSKIGIVIFVIGMGFLVKLGVDSGVITEGLRVAIGVVIGGGLIGLAHYLRKTFQKFSSILIGGALAVLYFTIALAFHEYQLIPQTASFIIMIFITVFAVLLSVAYDRKELAVLAIIGGFGTPFFLSTGSGNTFALFTYILILDIGMLALVNFKKWNIINNLAYGFTYLLFMLVYATKYVGDEDNMRTTLFVFLSCYYLLFFLMNIIYNVRNKRTFKYSEIIMLLSNSAIYFGFGLAIMQGYREGLFAGAFTALVALFNFVFAYTLYKRKGIDKNLLFLLIGLVLTFMSLIAPIQLDGNYITLFWALEAVLLMWLANKSKIEIMRATALVVACLMLISLLMDWEQNYLSYHRNVSLKVFFNKAFMTSIFSLLSLAGLTFLMKDKELISIKGLNFIWNKVVTKVVFILVLFFAFYLELNFQFIEYDFVDSLQTILLGNYFYVFVLGLLALKRYYPSQLLSKVTAALSSFSVLLYMTVFLASVVIARNIIVDGAGDLNSGFYWHYVLLILFVLITVDLFKYVFNQYPFNSKMGKIGLWAISFIGVFVCSAEAGHLSVLYQSSSGIGSAAAYSVAVKSVFPVVWAIFAFLLMVIGMNFRIKSLRISSLVLFLLTILKLFLYDLAGNSTGKIVSFVLLGAILLVISFLYQKLKFIIQDDQEESS